MSSADEPSPLPGLPGYNSQNIQPWTVEVVVSVTVLALAAVVLRIVSRHIKAQKLWWDDYFIIWSMLWNLVVVGFIFAMHSVGMGVHADKVEMDNIVLMAKYLVVAEILYAWNLGWTKLSLLLMYYRIFHIPFFKKMTWAVSIFVFAWVICITFLFIFICVPVEKLWYPDIPGHCINQVATWIANAASTIFTDLLILLLPLPQVWKLQLQKAEKIALTFAFGLGFFVVFTSAYRTSVLFTYSAADPTYTLAPTVGWTAIEMSAGIVSACLPTLRPAMQSAARACGIKGSMGGMFRSATALGFGSKNKSQFSQGMSSSRDPSGSQVARSLSTTKHGAGGDAFYRLPDDGASDGTRRERTPPLADSKLRPDTHGHGFGYTVASYPVKERDDKSEDEIPLHAIRVQKDFKHTTSLSQ
ncbi:Satratoxin biosynthesis SC1 cluster protein 4 [Colletotrichum orbiculare MAFF 240422]|uniref:Satratoxin biosynthesis SC1 cluster protein 4 n=2 Tax=Colletotrichum orbiculare species complex TaxID=2707354 RepID=N4V5S5_COLOR|nr:Satratoxin biosynthesis SC1 cluster protein 4 [Colletotrichum orbiculare MAFF 240422]TDZ33948.1 Satratoxin biosynthesis SC1 cluster protein 4 [Colletotrichum spinosum]